MNNKQSIEGLPGNMKSLLSDEQVPSSVQATPVQKKERLLSLDAYRGFTMLGMIVADHLEGMQGSAWWLVHQPWNGITLADLVFPAFLFIIGISLPLATSKKRPITYKNVLRVFMLFLIGFGLNIIEQLQFENLRIPGILQRSSICYGSVLFVHWFTEYGTHKIKRIIAAAFMLILVITYIPLMLTWQDPSIGCFKDNNLDPYCNFAGYVDRAVFTQNHILQETDPQGIISSMNSIVTSYMGYVFGLILVKYKDDKQKMIKTWLIIALICVIPIYPCSLMLPFNKRLWTTTFLFAVLSTSMAMLTLFFIIIDYSAHIKASFAPRLRKAIQPLMWMGMNPLAIFIVLQVLFDIMTNWIDIDGSTPYQLFYDACFSWMPPIIGTAVYGLFYAIFYFIVAGILFKYKLFLRL